MHLRYTPALLVSCSVFSVAVAAALQDTGAKAVSTPVSDQRAPHSKPVNLKVLPKDISSDDLDKLMHRYQAELGAPCGYCHEQNAETKHIDFASDENPVKGTARFMISMTNDINNKYLAQLGDRRYSQPISCGNCHQGQIDPPNFEPKP
jgi:cytochrome c553